eukprot:CAMPEP_0170168980 /NCGR_PEP_ID=MMETSP0040_2-20121228/1922_1 /TAXON_ID=641309 /ORGANISM="Lotharella oceanica, Strain CCMP622" /LENGTH=66 /DNA_ID=CAMNT_0010407453 /DNA_START=324 /DNA_END=524 /DNA_ORIENTATION=+
MAPYPMAKQQPDSENEFILLCISTDALTKSSLDINRSDPDFNPIGVGLYVSPSSKVPRSMPAALQA